MHGIPALPRELTIYTVSELRQQWLDALAAAGDGAAEDAATCTLDGAAVEDIDGAGVQLLLALARTCAARGARLALAPVSPSLARACERLGVGGVLLDASACAGSAS